MAWNVQMGLVEICSPLPSTRAVGYNQPQRYRKIAIKDVNWTFHRYRDADNALPPSLLR